jgi:hypothetical protein
MDIEYYNKCLELVWNIEDDIQTFGNKNWVMKCPFHREDGVFVIHSDNDDLHQYIQFDITEHQITIQYSTWSSRLVLQSLPGTFDIYIYEKNHIVYEAINLLMSKFYDSHPLMGIETIFDAKIWAIYKEL